MITLTLLDKLKRLNMFINLFRIHNGYLTIDLNDSTPTEPKWHFFYQYPIEELDLICTSQLYKFFKEFHSDNTFSVEDFANDLLTVTPESLDDLFDEIEHFKQSIDQQELSQEQIDSIARRWAKVIHSLIAVIYNYLSQMVYGIPLYKLLENPENAFSRTLICAIRIDKTLISYPEIQKRLIKAQMSGNDSFLDSFGSAIQKRNFHSKVQYPKVYFAFALFEREGIIANGKFINNSYREIIELLTDADFFKYDKAIRTDKQMAKVLKTYIRNKKNPF